ncbi:MAG: 1,4-alpha-glucan branching protein GlgB [Comamonadaceae bacterium]|nr:MAG: 1,4-alpha-glucan branching protein GlgB [Comamonadaceae bacterium]
MKRDLVSTHQAAHRAGFTLSAATPKLGDLDLHLITQGRHRELGRCLGAQPMAFDTPDGLQSGTRFAVWAPNARHVSVIGDFNGWNADSHPLQPTQAGVWEAFVAGAKVGERYKYAVWAADGRRLPDKADPVARATELPPGTASRIAPVDEFKWSDDEWISQREVSHNCSAPISVYEVHLASWLRVPEEGNRSLTWPELADRLVPYAKGLGFTHVELLPVMEHPFGGSWGYQPLSQFAPSARFGTPAEFAGFVDRCHQAGLGVILDWVPAHFPSDEHGLATFDGTALYEHADPREGFHKDWNTLIYNFGRNEVRGFLIASALEWFERYHVDGLRVDAVASMLYRDYSRNAGEWIPNQYGGRENLEAVAFLQELNTAIAERCPGVMMIAEESTAWPGVTAPVDKGGLGFTFKWNMGWMHDSLQYIERNTLYRQYHHHDLTFSLVYGFSEHFMLPISHDEVVHGKGSLLNKMPGDDWQKRANLRAYLAWMWGHPGKKLLFMGCELAQPIEWNHDSSPPWDLLDNPDNRGVQRLVRDLNRAYTAHAALHELDCEREGFDWLVGDDAANSVFALLRKSASGGPQVIVVSNLTPVPRHGYRIGVPGNAARWKEAVNTDAAIYGGSGTGNGGEVHAENHARHGRERSVLLTLPPLSTLVLIEDTVKTS